MELKDTRELKDFTKRCLQNESIYDFKGSIEIIQDYWKQSTDVEHFKNLVFNDKRLEHNQGYWELARENEIDFYHLMHTYLKDLSTKDYMTFSDIGSLKIGNDSFIYNIGNKYGDGNNKVYIVENDIHLNFNYLTTIKGNNINIYDYDCGDCVIHTLNGEYMVYVEELTFIFKKIK